MYFQSFSKESTILTLVVDGWIDQKLKKEASSSDNYFDQPAKPRAFRALCNPRSQHLRQLKFVCSLHSNTISFW